MTAPDTRRGPEARLSIEGRAASGLLVRFAKHPLVKGLAVIVGLLVLALVGRTAGAVPSAAPATPATATVTSTPAQTQTAAPSAPPPTATPASSAIANPAPIEHARRATVDDPVTINAASLDDLRRLPGIGPKRAQAILDLRTKLGRFRQVEDLMRVKGIGRATLKKLRPLVRLD